MTLHLSVDKEFTYLNYLSVMSAIRYNKVKMWVLEEPDNKYWSIVKKVKSIEFVTTTKEKGITMSYYNKDKIGRLDAIYLNELSENYSTQYMYEHENLYTPEGEFLEKDITIVKVDKPELITPEYIKDSDSVMAKLIRKVLLERVWNR